MWDSVKRNRATSTLPTCHSVKIEYCQDTYLKDLPKQGTEDSPWPFRPTATVRPPCNSKEWYRPGSAHRSWWKGSLKASGAGYKSHRKSPFEFHCFPLLLSTYSFTSFFWFGRTRPTLLPPLSRRCGQVPWRQRCRRSSQAARAAAKRSAMRRDEATSSWQGNEASRNSWDGKQRQEATVDKRQNSERPLKSI